MFHNTLEFGPLVLYGLLLQLWPEDLDGEVHHVQLHEVQHSEYLPETKAKKVSQLKVLYSCRLFSSLLYTNKYYKGPL